MYHPDYLGHTEFVSDANGDAYQYFWYSPFGDALVEEHANTASFSSRYLFNAKELDPETGRYYYGARYYDPGLSIWLSVDPLANKYPHSSPYNMSANNPINLFDPDGRTIVPAGESEEKAYSEYKAVVLNRIDNASSAEERETYQGIMDEITCLEESDREYHLVGNGGKFTYNSQKDQLEVQFQLEDNNQTTSMESLAHELKHADQFENGHLDLIVKPDGSVGGGILYDKHDEYEAYQRGNLFGVSFALDLRTMLKNTNPETYVNTSETYKNLPNGPRSYSSVPRNQYQYWVDYRSRKGGKTINNIK